jgi:cytochrome c oxidase subunit 1
MYQRTLAKWHFWLTMLGTNLTFFPMILLGYAGMPRRYATYDVAVGPVDLFTLLHQLATAGAFVLAIGQLIFVWNLVQSWLEGPRLTDGDPWNLPDHLYSREWQWFASERVPTLTDGGESDEE